ncbi:hypothetical protein Scani_55010 [Streptomyces caniferus]|uniref:Uncharacterized protein n=1 Tax=Streptomyces caniferus TaxID=285557 RepID=A0A640SCX3_9ACTN|nr:hypothetical protein Scani_55010 [Streptomyces caniferus]
MLLPGRLSWGSTAGLDPPDGVDGADAARAYADRAHLDLVRVRVHEERP